MAMPALGSPASSISKISERDATKNNPSFRSGETYVKFLRDKAAAEGNATSGTENPTSDGPPHKRGLIQALKSRYIDRTRRAGMKSKSNQSPAGGNKTPQPEVDVVNQNEEYEELELFAIKAFIQDKSDQYSTISLGFQTHKLPLQQVDIRRKLSKRKEEDHQLGIESYLDLFDHERSAIDGCIAQSPWRRSCLILLKRTSTDINHRRIFFKGVPELQFIIGIPTIKGSHALVGGHDGAMLHIQKQVKTVNLSRPTWMKVHRKYLSPDTLDAYDLPWEWNDVSLATLVSDPNKQIADTNDEQRDSNYMNIKRYLNEDGQDGLFEHTRKLREQREESPGPPILTNDRAGRRGRGQHMYYTDDSGLLIPQAGPGVGRSNSVSGGRPAQIVINNAKYEDHSPPHTSRSRRRSHGYHSPAYDDDSWDERAHSPRIYRDRSRDRSRNSSKSQSRSRAPVEFKRDPNAKLKLVKEKSSRSRIDKEAEKAVEELLGKYTTLDPTVGRVSASNRSRNWHFT
ncbi:MAG: hypothetical protein LQ339_008798 [Xanthoria mediterranea]|nr:MAG: hypothetical protein LQ339_008798 [Xanthoria mediterranea]